MWAGLLLGTLLIYGLDARAVETLSGRVQTAAGAPVAQAVVRFQTVPASFLTGADGRFTLHLPEKPEGVIVTAAAPGFYVGGARPARDGETVITLRPLPGADNAAYRWVSPFKSAGSEDACENCHASERAGESLPFDQWRRDAHGTAAVNARFLSMYKGTDLAGTKHSPPTRYVANKDYGRAALPPDLRQPYYGPGYQLDFPGQGGNCAACHAPGAAMDSPYGTRMDGLAKPAEEGITCDICHKISDVRLNPATGRPHLNTPGILSLAFTRPPAAHELRFGPLDDVFPGDDAYLPLYRESRYCAACHDGQFWGVQIYNAFAEWATSPYAAGPDASTCQDCHMPRTAAALIARRDRGGKLRREGTIANHHMRGPDDAAFMRSAARLDLAATVEGDVVKVRATVTNTGAGHSLPTDQPARNILLVIEARDDKGNRLDLIRGPEVPAWGGQGAAPEDYAGRPGKGFAKILEETWTGISPTAAYWTPTVVRSDNRIAAKAEDVSAFEFRGGKPARITGRLIYRRAFRELARVKGWTDPDLTMQTTVVDIP